MTSSAAFRSPALALLLDVDGPIASPITRRISEPGLAENLVRLAHAGIPVIFNTGRSDVFITSIVMPALHDHGLRLTPDASGHTPTVFAICEKGATSYVPAADPTQDTVQVRAEYALPPEVRNFCRQQAESFTDVMFWDDTKHAMVSLEAHPGIDLTRYRERQAEFDAALWAELRASGRPLVWGERTSAAAGEHLHDTPIRIDTTIISTDVELATTGKDLGADVALAELQNRGITPKSWRTVGDSRGDYAMADRLHELGFDVRHVDVRPGEGMLQRPYPVDTAKDAHDINDVAGAQYVAQWCREHAKTPGENC